jgi:hypothetical protein
VTLGRVVSGGLALLPRLSRPSRVQEFVDGVLVASKIEISTISSPWTR